jgi:hypothetical protein
MHSENFQHAWKDLVDSITQHPSTKPYKPLTIREQQLETEVLRLRQQIRQCIALLKLMVDPADGLPDDGDEELF